MKLDLPIKYPYSEYGYYEEKYQLKEKHDKMLELLIIFDQFCRQNKLKYSLADGTLLGAVRHGNFIPWDDDADVMMTREEYNRLRSILNGKSPIKLFKIHFLDRFSAPGYIDEGYYIDLFINEDMPASKMVFFWKKNVTRFLRTSFNNQGTSVRNVRHDGFNPVKSFTYNIIRSIMRATSKLVIGKRDVFEWNDKLVSIGCSKPSGIYTRFTSRMFETNRRFNKSKYNEGYADIQFRNTTLMCIKNADVFLKEMYGDYMTLLPEAKRKPEHGINMLEASPTSIRKYN